MLMLTIAAALSLMGDSGNGRLELEGPLERLHAIDLDGLGRFQLSEPPLLGLQAAGPLRGMTAAGEQVLLRRHLGQLAGRVIRPGKPVIAFRSGPEGRLQWSTAEPLVEHSCGAGDPVAADDDPPPPPQRDGAGDSGDTIDVLAVYTSDALAAGGSVAAMETDILSWFDASNGTLSDSGINTQLRVVGMDLVEGIEDGDLLEQLRLTSDGMYDSVHATRDGLGADVVVMFVESTDEDDNGLDDYCGIAYVIKTLTGRPDYAFGVVKRSCAQSGYTLVHEVGHLHGCAHDAANAGISGIEPHAYGWVFWGAGDSCDQDRYCTVMAYGGLDEIDDCPDPGDSQWVWTQRIGLFSTPTLSHDGTPVGDADDADNVTVWNDRCSVTAGYRTSVIPVDCPGDIDASGEVDMFDLLGLLSVWGPAGGGDSADINEDLQVGVLDLLVLLDRFGRCT